MCDIRDMNIYHDINGHDMIYEIFLRISIVKNGSLSIELQVWLKQIMLLNYLTNYKLGLYQVTNSVYNVRVHTDLLQFNQFTIM